MSTTSHIKCPNCGVFNTNKTHCESCGFLISHQEKETARAKTVQEEELVSAVEKIEKVNFIKKLKRHPFFLVRFFGWILNSVWIVLNIIGAFIAWFVAMVAAG
ncbi:hypothetical protein GCM10011416_01870 [Polaribacter pacificus]|uniref:Zinc-ribbon domain-containing protein n=1 Tax=Polaribacter pacificus TaxID=1775173 RepID=A0A917HU34_9FLAO|nr:hypothetical protein [Polaribacter pacificus]GGG89087.1 hypothetical protein GCM10011416_01870 [Polaribacter pacificus]